MSGSEVEREMFVKVFTIRVSVLSFLTLQVQLFFCYIMDVWTQEHGKGGPTFSSNI